jgi:hypothetical protein
MLWNDVFLFFVWGSAEGKKKRSNSCKIIIINPPEMIENAKNKKFTERSKQEQPELATPLQIWFLF